MKVGLSISMQSVPPASATRSIYRDELATAELAEPLGFDSIGAVEHHFTGYAMIPNCVQLLTFMAARTKRLTLVTTVIVLPWHDPVRVAEEMAMLDVLSEWAHDIRLWPGRRPHRVRRLPHPDGGGARPLQGGV